MKYIFLLAIGTSILLYSCDQNITNTNTINSDMDSISYALGVDIANTFDMNSLHSINYDKLIDGLCCAIIGFLISDQITLNTTVTNSNFVVKRFALSSQSRIALSIPTRITPEQQNAPILSPGRWYNQV